MRPLTEEETKTVFSKLATYCSDLKSLISPLDDGDRYVFRLNHARVYYVRLSIANIATSVSRDQLLSLGTCLGKLTKTGKFRLHITALPILAENARHKIWVKENGAQPFLYGSNGMFLVLFLSIPWPEYLNTFVPDIETPRNKKTQVTNPPPQQSSKPT